MYININTLEKLTEQGIKAQNPNTSYPNPFLEPEGYAFIFPAPKPEHDPLTQIVLEGVPELTGLGHWEERWVIAPRFQDFTDSEGVLQTAAAQEAATIAETQMLQLQALQNSIISQTQLRLDTFAKTKNYDGILSACTYATSSIPQFAAEGQAAVAARDQTWSTLYTILAEVQGGLRAVPTGFLDIESSLPALTWPTV